MQRTGAELLLDCLLSLGASQGFGVPGESYLALLDAFHGRGEQFTFTSCRNEGGASFMAEAYGKLTRTPGLCFATRGPGASNASIGVHTAMQNSTPMLLFVGQASTDMLEREAFQEVDYKHYFGGLAKWVVQINEAARVPELVSRAWSTAQSGRPGPVVLALPENMLVQTTDVPVCKAVRISEPAPTEQLIEECVTHLNAASRPLLLVGGSRWTDAGRSLLNSFVRKHPMPVAAAFRFQDTVDNNSDCYVGDAGVAMTPQMQSLIMEADLILAIGVRLGEMTTRGYSLLDVPDAKQTLIHVHPSDRELGKVYNPALPIHAGPNQFINALSNKALDMSCEPWLLQARSEYQKVLDVPVQPGGVDMAAVTRIVAAQLPHDAIVTNGAGNFSTWPNRYLSFGPQQRLLAPQSGAMGYGLPAAIMAKQQYPERLVLCFCGDGDFQMNCQELGTAMQINACPIVLIVNNSSYGTIRMHQERCYPARVSGTDIHNPDFSKLASAYGFYAERVEKTDDFSAAFERAKQSPTGAVLDLVTSIEALTPRETLESIRNKK